MDSRGYPTVEVDLTTDLGTFGAAVPSGTSKGSGEAVELRDGGMKYLGMGVSRAVKNVNQIIGPKLKGKDACDQISIDELMIKLDATENKSKLGANAILGVSMAVSRAGAASQDLALWQWLAKIAKRKPKLPHPCLLYFEGGLHGRGDLDTQELMAVVEAGSFKEELRLGTELYHTLREILIKKYDKYVANVGLEGGFTPPIQDTEGALKLLTEAAQKTGSKIKIILDMAANTFSKNSQYYFEGEILSKKDLSDFYFKICDEYPVMALEDPFNEADWDDWKEITENLGENVFIIGDDLLTTNIEKIKTANQKQACNALILKPNQIGTVWETIEAAKLAQKYGWQVFVKHRSGETSDAFISDLAVGIGAEWLMAGAPNRGERVAKYNHLLRIEEKMKNYG